MRAVFDGLTSLLAAIATLAICGIPGWFTFQAIQAELAPIWVYAPLAGLVGVGAIMTVAFLRKAAGGISPSRSRRRR